MPLALSDSELAAVMEAARPIPTAGTAKQPAWLRELIS
jgi:hypothetical protein